MFVISLRNTQFVLMAFRLLLLISKTTNYYYEHTIGTLNAHAFWRGCAYVRMGAWSYLLISKHYPRFSFELNGCHLWLDTYCLT